MGEIEREILKDISRKKIQLIDLKNIDYTYSAGF